MQASSIKVSIYDRLRYTYLLFNDLSALRAYFMENYATIYRCKIGKFVAITAFNIDTNLYNFNIGFYVRDICNNTSITEKMDYDRTLNTTREVFRSKQLNVLNNTLNQYCILRNEIRNIYMTGIYSPCYAEAGWSEGTSRLAELRKAVDTNKKIFEIKTT
jgi:hypothetical protein